MKFEEVLPLLKNGKSIFREGWNGKNQFVFILKGAELQNGLEYGYGEYEMEPTFVDTLVLRNAQNLLVVGWVPSMGDLFAKDWEIL